VARAFDSIETVLDRLLNKDISSPAERTGEDRISKLTFKTDRILTMCLSKANQSNEEREIIQGFISDMSHQMKTPLSGISMYADLLLEGNASPDELREFLFRIKSNADKLQWMMDSLIKMSRLEIGAIQLSPSFLNIKPTLSDAVGSVLAAAYWKGVEIKVKEFTDIPLYHDRKWTCEALVNIIENAVKYSHSNSLIEISAETLPLYTKIIIADNGIGIGRDEWNGIFKRFYRGRNVKDKEGAGLGLYIAALIMERQSGYIMVDSVPDRFTSFSLFLQNRKE
jgi:signal transduction histidine kinase